MSKGIRDIDMSDSDNAEGDLPAEEIVKRAQEVIDRGGFIFFKFTCEFCGSRQTGAVPNTFHSAGYHCEECGELCRPKKYGIMAIFTRGLTREQLLNIVNNVVNSKIEKNQKGDKKINNIK